jgi:hypothetical protein
MIIIIFIVCSHFIENVSIRSCLIIIMTFVEQSVFNSWAYILHKDHSWQEQGLGGNWGLWEQQALSALIRACAQAKAEGKRPLGIPWVYMGG